MLAKEISVKKLRKITGEGSPHLLPALVAIVGIIALLAGGSLFARYQEQKYVNVLASVRIKQTDIGSALQEAGLRQPDLLPVFSSSEMYNENDENSANR